jgi:fructokinase
MTSNSTHDVLRADKPRIYGCIEAGGTKFVVGIVKDSREILETVRIDTTTPDATIGASVDWLLGAAERHGPLTAIGIASFGPLELGRQAANWGHITATTKPGWSHTDFAGRVGRAMDLPVGFDTDVNGAALAEARWGEARDCRIGVYLTIGTGIGGGAVVDGQTLHGLSHPEMGHIRVPRHPEDRDFPGICPFHGDCLEGLASGPAISARWGASLSQLGTDHPGHAIIAFYLAQIAVTLQSIMEPGRIVMGGGVMGTPGLLARVQAEASRLGSGYFCGSAEKIITAPALGEHSGLLGALALAQDRC